MLVRDPPYWQGDATETGDVVTPITIESRVNNAVVSRRVIETFLICDHADVLQIIKEN